MLKIFNCLSIIPVLLIAACGQVEGEKIEIPASQEQFAVKCLMGNCPAENMQEAVYEANKALGYALLTYEGYVSIGETDFVSNGVIPVVEVQGLKKPFAIKQTPGWGISMSSEGLDDVASIKDGLLTYLEKFYF